MDRPVSWCGGYVFGITSIITDLTVVMVTAAISLSRATNERVFQIWQDEKCSLSTISTALIERLMNDSMNLKYDLSHLELLVMTGQRYPLPSVTALLDMFTSLKVQIYYGATEAILIAVDTIEKDAGSLEERYGKLLAGGGIEVKVVDEANRVIPRGEVGEICVRSCTVFLEYASNQEATKQAKSLTGWVSTGDTGVMDDDGKITLLGRKTEIIKRATVRIFPAEIEKVISKHHDVEAVAVVGVPDQQLNEEICACVILREDAKGTPDKESTRLQELENWCKEQWLPGPDGLSLTPKYFVPMKRFPVTLATGKVYRQGIKAEAMKHFGTVVNL